MKIYKPLAVAKGQSQLKKMYHSIIVLITLINRLKMKHYTKDYRLSSKLIICK